MGFAPGDEANMEKAIRILHISDFHFREGTHWDAIPLLKELHSAVRSLSEAGLTPDLVTLTGDIAFSGKRKEYDLARRWIDDALLAAIPEFNPDNLFIIPGNHDIDRAEVTIGVKAMEEELRKGDQFKIADILCGPDAPNVYRRHTEYLKFVNTYRRSADKINGLWWTQVRKFDGFRLGIAGLASSIISFGDDSNDKGRLVISRYQLHTVLGGLPEVDVRLALIHHPISYFVDEQEAAVQMETGCSVMLRGHLHTPKAIAHQAPSSGFLELAAGSVYSDSQYANSFQVIELDPKMKEVRVYYYLWQNLKWITDLNSDGINRNSGCAVFPLRFLRPRTNALTLSRAETSENQTTERLERPTDRRALGQLSVERRKSWSRTVPKLPLPTTTVTELSKLLEEIRVRAFKLLKKHKGRLLNRHVRGNVFLLDYRQPHDGCAYTLYMPEELRKKMNYPPEWDIRFNPGQGATGLAFETGRQRISKRLSKQKGDWDSVFHLTDDLKKKVHKDLEWIVTLPLKDPVTELTLAILNIDGLDYQFPDEVLSEVVLSLISEIKAFGVSLAEQPRVSISFSVEEIVT
jgi:predicted phosphodiesterase